MLCPSRVEFLKVTNSADASQLAEVVDCEGGGGSFVVQWMGRVAVEVTISVSNGTSLEITSLGTADATIEGNGGCLLFNVTSAALILSNMSLNHGSGTIGGAIAGDFANVTCNNCRFFGNGASATGGAISVTRSNVSFAGETICRRNSAGLGGGCVAAMEGSLLEFAGQSTFQDNVASSDGGAVYVHESEAIFTGNNYFNDNTAGDSGGAVLASHGTLAFFGDDSSAVFVNNTAVLLFGGALSFDGKLTLILKAEHCVFKHNRAPTGGAVYIAGRSSESAIGAARFTSNSATLNGGAMVLSRPGANDKNGKSRAFTMINCTFEDNTAGRRGGALVVSAGYVRINDTIFRNNTADESGGGILVDSGYSNNKLSLGRCKLSYNQAATGPAVMIVKSSDDTGENLELYDVVFTGNELFCGSKEFLMETPNHEIAGQDLAYKTVCNSCANISLCDTCVVSNPDTVALCKTILDHTTSPDASGTLASLWLEEGYWRTSNVSSKILRCYHKEACLGTVAESCGGVDCEGGYCATGYRGPYCAVCDEGYTWGQGYACVKCTGDSTPTTEALGIIGILVMVAVFVCMWQYLTSLPRPNVGRSRLGWRKCVWRVYEAIPFQAIKIIIVTWQIVTEFSSVANVSFPAYYKAFLGVVKVFNLDLTRMLPLECYFQSVDFYHRLLAITIAPLILGLLLLVTFWFARRRHCSDGQSMVEVRRRHRTILILISFLVYSSASSTVFKTFACDRLDDGRYYLRADYRLRCHRNDSIDHDDINNVVPVHRAYMIYAGLMIAVYPIGIPILYGVLAWSAWRRLPHRVAPPSTHISGMEPYIRQREGNESSDRFKRKKRPSRMWPTEEGCLSEPAQTPWGHPLPIRQGGTDDIDSRHEYHKWMMRDLWKPYKRDRLFYEVVECTRRLMLTGVIVFIYPGSLAQISTAFLLALVFFAVFEALDPYKNWQDCWMSRFGHVIVLLSMLIALMLRIDLTEETDTGEQMYDVILTVANVLMLLAVFCKSMFSLYFSATPSTGGRENFDDEAY